MLVGWIGPVTQDIELGVSADKFMGTDVARLGIELGRLGMGSTTAG